MRYLSQKLLFCALIGICGCSAMEDPYVQTGTTGGLLGAGIGAGTGALVGSLISNGNIGESALLGTAIGVPVGIAATVAYKYYTEESELSENEEQIRGNHKHITKTRDEIEALEYDLYDESMRTEPDRGLKAETYTGPTIGVYR